MIRVPFWVGYLSAVASGTTTLHFAVAGTWHVYVWTLTTLAWALIIVGAHQSRRRAMQTLHQFIAEAERRNPDAPD